MKEKVSWKRNEIMEEKGKKVYRRNGEKEDRRVGKRLLSRVSQSSGAAPH